MTLTGKSHDQVTKQERNMSKSGNFGICYGGTEHALQKTLLKLGFRKSLDECFAIVQAVKRTYPAIPVFQESIGKQAQEDGYVEAIYGYKRLLPDINSSDRSLMNRDKRRAANTPIQGSAAEIMKRNQNRLYDWIGK
jgi:DNA polymerase-1